MSEKVKFNLSRDEFVETVNSEDGKTVVRLTAPLDTEIDADVNIKPLEAYSALRNGYSFLLESAEKDVSAFKQVKNDSAHDTGARYSFVGFDPDAVVRVRDRKVKIEELRNGTVTGDISSVVENRDGNGNGNDDETGEIIEGYDTLDALRAAFPDVERVNFEETERQVFSGGLVGFHSYDIVDDLWLSLRDYADGEEKEKHQDDSVFVLSTRNIIFDHDKGSVELVFTPIVSDEDDAADVYDSLVEEAREVVERIRKYEPRDVQGFEILDEDAGEREEYEDAVAKTREHIYDGDIYQAVLSRKRKIEAKGDIRDFYAELREVNPSPYMYLLEFEEFGVVGSSPETLFSVHGDRVSTNPIAGTCPRGETAVEDRRLAGEMLSDEKELSEHVMLVDLGRNDVRRVSKSGTINVDDFMSVVQYSHVQHIESTVSGELRDGKDAFDATRSIFPAGTLSGAPKIRAMEIIDELEPEARGAYGGGVGYYSWNGDSDFAITIRTATFDRQKEKSVITVQAGAGIVADSVPEHEYEETESKMDALLQTLENLNEKERKKTHENDDEKEVRRE
ncbi:MAG: anthranilate synthase component I [Halobacteria archaeon]|nr:anthranilate synthase component I [Halobacteria archaeon]